jgi:two-component system sensor kinase FixL
MASQTVQRTDVTGLARHETESGDLTAKLNKATEELAEFTYIISHDLQAPLRAIKTLSDWISTDYGAQLGADGKEQMDLLVNRVDRMQALIEGVLQYSRIGRMTEALVPVDLNKLLPRAIESVSCSGSIQVVIQENLPTVNGEPTRIRQVFQNLLSNAVKFMDKPDGQIQVRCQGVGEFWQFSITDNGPGIDSEYFEKIFKMFQTLVPRDEFESTGAGLTLVRKIVDLYNGRIWVESKVGQGSTFHFTYPKTIQAHSYQAE